MCSVCSLSPLRQCCTSSTSRTHAHTHTHTHTHTPEEVAEHCSWIMKGTVGTRGWDPPRKDPMVQGILPRPLQGPLKAAAVQQCSWAARGHGRRGRSALRQEVRNMGSGGRGLGKWGLNGDPLMTELGGPRKTTRWWEAPYVILTNGKWLALTLHWKRKGKNYTHLYRLLYRSDKQFLPSQYYTFRNHTHTHPPSHRNKQGFAHSKLSHVFLKADYFSSSTS